MNESMQMLAAMKRQVASRREQHRRDFPDVALIVDELTAAFGPVKVLHASENGREVGKSQPFDGIDVDKVIAMDDWSKHANRGKRR